jgi:uncharacterized membrane protein YdjX (TVP38/TMEM64 family)
MADAAERAPRDWALRWLPAAFLLVAAIVAYRTGALAQLTPHWIAEHHYQLQSFVGRWPAGALCVYIATYAVLTGACLPVALVLTLAAGMYFGTVEAGFATVAASTIGAIGTYAAARSALAPWLRNRARSSPQMEKALHHVRRDAVAYIVAARLLPLFPSSAATIAAGIAGTSVRKFTAATMLGAVPASFVYSSVGAGLEGGMGSWNGSIWGLLSEPSVLGPLIGLASLAAAAPLVRSCWRARLARG